MRRAAPLSLLLSLACRTPDSPVPTNLSEGSYAAARAADVAAFEREGPRLASEHEGQWVVIADGAVRAIHEDFGPAWGFVERSCASHAFLYRAGVDEGDVSFVLSPFTSARPRWTQLGRRFVRPYGLTLEAVGDVWHRELDNGVLRAEWGESGARVELAAPGGAPTVVERGVASMMFEDDVTLTEDAADELGLGRIEAPGEASYGPQGTPCRKVVVRVRIPELAVDAPAVGYVLPRSVTGRMPVSDHAPVGWTNLLEGVR